MTTPEQISRPDRRRPDRPPRRVTAEQRRTLQILAGLILIHRRAPALAELARTLGISKPAAHYRLHWLGKKGLYSSSSRRLTASGLQDVLAELEAIVLPETAGHPVSLSCSAVVGRAGRPYDRRSGIRPAL